MSLVKNVGNFFPMDTAGNILNPTALSKIPSNLIPLLEDVVTLFKKYESQNLHSIWLRGSVPRGFYVPEYSDLDVFALVKSPNITWQTAPWAEKANVVIQNKYQDFPPIEWQLSSWYSDFYINNPRLSFFLKTQSLFLFGDNFQADLPDFKISTDIQINLKWLNEDVVNFLNNNNPTISEQQAIIKVVIRSAFEAVMLKEKKYTTDLYGCAQIFSKYYPEAKQAIFEILEDYITNEISFNIKENIKKVNLIIRKVINLGLFNSFNYNTASFIEKIS